MRQFTDTLHPALGPTTLRGYTTRPFGAAQKHLEGAIIATVGKPVRVKWSNELPLDIPLPVDPSLVDPYTYGESLGNDRAAPHLHGGLVPWPSDGGPFHWFNNPANTNGSPVKGPSVGGEVATWLGGTDDYWYPNIQTPRFMWYHDHAVGLTRLNPYLGLASGYILTDTTEATLMAQLGFSPTNLTEYLTRQIHLVVQDKIFAPSSSNGSNPSNLWYPDVYDTQFFALDRKAPNPLPVPSTVAEFWAIRC